MVDSRGFGGRDTDVVSIPAQELVTHKSETPLTHELEEDQYRDEVELPESWAEEYPARTVRDMIGDEVYDILSTGSEAGLLFDSDTLRVFPRAVALEDELGEYRVLSEIFFPVDEYQGQNGVNNTGAIAYDTHLSPKTSEWQTNTEKEVFHYRISDEIEGDYVRDLLFDGLYQDEGRHMRPQWDSENSEPGYTGSITIDYSRPI